MSGTWVGSQVPRMCQVVEERRPGWRSRWLVGRRRLELTTTGSFLGSRRAEFEQNRGRCGPLRAEDVIALALDPTRPGIRRARAALAETPTHPGVRELRIAPWSPKRTCGI